MEKVCCGDSSLTDTKNENALPLSGGKPQGKALQSGLVGLQKLINKHKLIKNYEIFQKYVVHRYDDVLIRTPSN